jgi:hypothetical protein
MQASIQRFRRLLTALETWFAESCFLLEQKQFSHASAKRSECQLAISELAVLLQDADVRASLDADSQKRTTQLLERYRAESAKISDRKQRARQKIDALKSTHSRAKHFRNAYGAQSEFIFSSAFANRA